MFNFPSFSFGNGMHRGLGLRSGIAHRPNTLAWLAAGGSASASTLALMDAFDASVASIKTKFINGNLECGTAFADAIRPQYLGDGTTTWGSATWTNYNFLATETQDPSSWTGRSYFQGDYQETGPNGGIDSQRWGYAKSGYTPPSSNYLGTGVFSNGVGTNNIMIAGWGRDNMVSQPLAAQGFFWPTPDSSYPIISSNNVNQFQGYWGAYGSADYAVYSTSNVTGFVALSRVAANDTKLYSGTTQRGTFSGTSSVTNSGLEFKVHRSCMAALAGSFVTKGLTSTEEAILYNALLAFNTGLNRVGPFRQIVFLGDSITAGFGGVKPWWMYLYTGGNPTNGWAFSNYYNWYDLRIRVRAFNGAAMGLTSDANGSVGACNDYIGALAPDGTFYTKTIFVIFAGTNDIGALGQTASYVWNGSATNGMKKFIQNRLAESANNWVVVVPPLPRSDAAWSSGKETQRLALINYMDTDMPSGNVLYASALKYFPAPDSSYGVSPVDATLWQADKLHPSTTGQQAIATSIFGDLVIP
jgi:lysophospholipase L1-like esterase